MNRKLREFRIRRKLAKLGYQLQRGTNSRNPSNPRVGYRIVNIANRFVEAGENYTLSLSDVEKFLRYGR